MNQLATILMGDVVGSRDLDSEKVQTSLQAMVASINQTFANPGIYRPAHREITPIQILSPLTITLGDEFQGVASDLAAAVQILFAFEEYRLHHKIPFELHFVTYLGPIDTAINEETAHGMLGAGLTHARHFLTDKSRSRRQFRFGYLFGDDGAPTETAPPRPLTAKDRERNHRGAHESLFAPQNETRSNWLRFQLGQLTGLFALVETLVEHWKPKDFELIDSMITHPHDDAHVGEIHGKNRSQIWKRRRTLRIDDYLTLKGLAADLAAPAAR